MMARNTLLRLLGIAAVMSIALPVRAEPMRAREGAHVQAPGAWSVGLIAPARVGIAPRIEIGGQALAWLLLSPNAELRVGIGEIGGWTFATTAGLSLPTMNMRLLQGYLFPKWETSERKPGWVLVPSFGVLASSGPATDANLFTLHFDSAFGVPFGDREATPLETYAPLELLYAPALNGVRTRGGATYSRALVDWLRVRVLGEMALTGLRSDVPKSPVVLHGSLTGEVGLGRRVRLELGVHAYDSDQRRTELVTQGDGSVRREHVRSFDVFPAFDIVVTSR